MVAAYILLHILLPRHSHILAHLEAHLRSGIVHEAPEGRMHVMSRALGAGLALLGSRLLVSIATLLLVLTVL